MLEVLKHLIAKSKCGVS